MRILLLTHSFNGLAQRLFGALREHGHSVSVELDIADSVTEEAVALFKPDVVIAPFLKRRIPMSVWSQTLCLVVHPGIPGDKGPSALDWMILRGDTHWGVTVLQAVDDFDAGPVWAWEPFAVRALASKSSIYRREVTHAAVLAVLRALERVETGQMQAAGLHLPVLPPQPGQWNPLMPRAQRLIHWEHDSTHTMLLKISASDGFPGVADALWTQPVRLFDAHAATPLELAPFGEALAGDVIARRGPAVLRKTRDGGVWIGHVRLDDGTAAKSDGTRTLKLATTRVFASQVEQLPEVPAPLMRADATWDELRYQEFGSAGARVGWLRFDFYNGAMSERQCGRLKDALQWIRKRPTQVLVLAGGQEFFSNGIHLHDIEAAQADSGDSAADASWRAINAIDDVALEILTMTDRITVSALHGNAGAGGCFLALAADLVWAHADVVLNPHYKNMGNLYGSEYWTYSLPKRIGMEASRAMMQQRLPLGAVQACEQGVIDACLGDNVGAFGVRVLEQALSLAASHNLHERLHQKQQQRNDDEAYKPLAQYREEELQRMKRNFFGFDPSYHVARHHFVYRKPHAWTPRHLAPHRDKPAITPMQNPT